MILPLQGAALKGDAVTQGAALGYEMFFLCFATKAAKPSGPFGAYVTRAEGTFHAAQPPSILSHNVFLSVMDVDALGKPTPILSLQGGELVALVLCHLVVLQDFPSLQVVDAFPALQ